MEMVVHLGAALIMVRLKRVVAATLMSSVIWGCSSSSEYAIPTREIILSESSVVGTDAYMVDNVSFLALMSDEANTFSSIDKLLVRNDMIYVLDRRLARVFVFGMDGDLRFSIKRRGRGPGEYLEAHSFSVDDKYVYILDNMTQKLHAYDCHNGTFAYSLDMPDDFWDVESLENGGFLLAYSQGDAAMRRERNLRYRVVVTDINMNIIDRHIGFNADDVDLLSYHHYLCRYDEHISFCSFNEDACYVFSSVNGELQEKISFVFDNPLTGDKRVDMDAVFNGPYTFMRETPIVFDGYCYLKMAFGQEGRSVIADTATGKTVSQGRICPRFIHDAIGTSDCGFVGVIDSGERYDILTKFGFPRASSELEDAVHQDVPVLVFYNICR